MPSFRRVSLACLVCVAFAAPAPAQLPAGVTKVTTVEGITEYKLANGLRVLLIPDASQPKVTVNMTIFCGSRHEGYGETGMAHLLEHMVFKGCPKFPDVPKALRDHGAQFNGTTWVDRTNYYETMPATDDNLEFGIELEADRLVNSFIKREDLLSEFSVVRNEFEMGENSPERVLMQRMMATAFEWHNYGKSTIGNRADIERVPIDNLQAFYKKFYRVDNALLVVAGKFDEKKALEFVAKYLGPLKKPDEALPKTYTEEPAQDGERVVTLRRVGTVGVTGACYHIPAGSSPEFAAVSVLEGCLSTEPAGRMYKALVETKKATSVLGIAFQWHDPGLMLLGATCEPGKTDEVRDTLIATLEGLADKPVTDEEVSRVKTQMLKGREQLFANSQQLAIALSDWAGNGDWKLFFLHRDRLEKVTAADVNAAAKKYLIRANRTVGVYVPTKTPERAAIPAAGDIDAMVKDYKGRAAVASGESFETTPENIEKRVARGTIADGVKTAMLAKKTRGETVDLTWNIRFGNEDALKGKLEASQMVGAMLKRGTKTKSRQQIDDQLSELGASLSVSSGGLPGLMAVSLKAKRPNLTASLALLSEVLREPTFPEKEFEQLKAETLEALDKGKTEPDQLAVNALRRKLSPYPADDVRYTPTIDEQIARAKAVSLDAVKDVYATMIGASGELAVVGDFDAAEVTKQLDAALKGWAAKVPFKRIASDAKTAAGGTVVIPTPDKANAMYVAGITLPISDTDPDYAALVVGNYAFGAAPLASRLSNRVRGKDGLSYGVGSMVQASPLDKVGRVMVFAIANPTNIPKVDAAIADEWAKFLKDGLSADELEGAKKAYVQSRQVQRASDPGLAGQLANDLYTGRTMAFAAEFEKKIETIQPGDVQKAFAKHVDPKKIVIVQAGDFKK